METKYISCPDAAKMIRAELKTHFPGIKFSVKSSSYSGGASIAIGWTDGPTEKAVDTIVGKYEGKTFDGMIDMATGNYAYLLPDGTVTWGGTRGTTSSMGFIEAQHTPQPIKGHRVRFGSDYISCSRHYSLAFLRRVAEETCQKWGKAMPEISDGYFGAQIDRATAERLNDWNYDTIGDAIYRVARETAA